MGSIKAGIEWCLKITRLTTSYSRGSRNTNECNGYTGSPQYFDCTSFVTGYAFKGGWLPKYLIAGNNSAYTGDMGFWLTKYGFKRMPMSTVVRQGDVVVRNNGNMNDHAEVVYTNEAGATVNSNNYKTIGTGGSYPHAVIVQWSNGGSSPWNEMYRPISGGDDFVSDGYGWTLTAFCAMLGSIAHEGIYNPGQLEAGYGGLPDSGHGLIQWTNANWGTGYNPLLGAAQHFNKRWSDGFFQAEMLANANVPEYKNGGTNIEQWGWMGNYASPSSFDDYRFSTTIDLDTLTKAWYYNVEWHSYQPEFSLPSRIETARMWYNRLKDVDPTQYAGLSFVERESSALNALTNEEKENNALLLYNLFCGSGGGGYGEDQGDGIGRHKKVWNIIYSQKPWRLRK